MAIASQLPQLILSLRRLLQFFKPSLIPRALRRILGRLALIWSILRTKLGLGEKGITKPPSPSQGDPRKRKAPKTVTRSKHTDQERIAQLESESISYTLTEQGEIISLDNVALSAYPFRGSIRSNRSTYSLPKSNRSSRNLSITRDNNASRSSQGLSDYSGNSNHSTSIHGDSGTTRAAHLTQPSRDLPAWQQTLPTPHRQDTIPGFEVIPPEEEGFPTDNADVGGPPIPTRPATPAFKKLNNSHISPKMPETFANRRYQIRPRM